MQGGTVHRSKTTSSGFSVPLLFANPSDPYEPKAPFQLSSGPSSAWETARLIPSPRPRAGKTQRELQTSPLQPSLLGKGAWWRCGSQMSLPRRAAGLLLSNIVSFLEITRGQSQSAAFRLSEKVATRYCLGFSSLNCRCGFRSTAGGSWLLSETFSYTVLPALLVFAERETELRKH